MPVPPAPTCQRCGHVLPADAPHGICPQCLVAMNFASQTGWTGETSAAVIPPPSVGDIAPLFPQLEILEFLGRGGMGIVYKARQKALARVVALKLLAPEREHNEKFAERFEREAQALAALDHPNIVTIHDFGQASGYFYLLMEYVDGLNLRQVLQARKLSPEEALGIVPKLCEALQFAHDRGIVHRDIKPENLLLAKDGRIKVADFGIAKIIGGGGSSEEIAGTPAYMAPEQKQTPNKTDSRADIYSLGVVLYEMLTGELPKVKIVPPSRRVAVDLRVDEVVLRALETSPELRWQTADSFRMGVETCTQAASAPSTRPPKEARLRGAEPWMSWQRFAIIAASLMAALGVLLAGLILLYGSRQAPRSATAAAAELKAARSQAPETPDISSHFANDDKATAAEQPKAKPNLPEIAAAREKLARAMEEYRVTAAAYNNKTVSRAQYDKSRFPVEYALAVQRGDLEKAGNVREKYRQTYTSRQDTALSERYISPMQKLEALRDLDAQCAETESTYAVLAGQILPSDPIVDLPDAPASASADLSKIADHALITAYAFAPDADGGVGVVLNRPNEIIYVGDVLPGSPASASQLLHQGDRILAVGEGEQAALLVAGKSLEDVVAMIRGAKGTRVRLTVASPGQPDSGAREVALIRAEIKAISAPLHDDHDGKSLFNERWRKDSIPP